MKVLHLLSNWKWTGPAEPALETAALLDRSPGVRVVLAHTGRTRGEEENYVAREAERLGLRRLPGLELPRHFSLATLGRDSGRLAACLDGEDFDLLHCHLKNDHLTAALARLRGRSTPPVVRTWYDPEGPRGWREAWLVRRATAGAILPGRRARDRVARKGRGRIALETALPPLDLERFSPAGADMRSRYLAEPGDFLAGVVARIQPHRKWDLLLAAFRRALASRPELKLVVIGRGEGWESDLYGPARAMGVAERLVMAGYRREEEYDGSLRSLDCIIFLQPGSDGTCRALRQGLAVGLPALVTRRGLLPELVRDGETGFLVDEEPGALATALVRLAADRELARSLGRAAREEAEVRYAPERYLELLLSLYRRVVR